MVKTRTSGPVKGPAGAALPVPPEPNMVGLLGAGLGRNAPSPLDRSQGDAYHASEAARVRTSRAPLNAAPYTKKKGY